MDKTIAPKSDKSLSSDEKTWGMLAHLSTLLGAVIPFANIVAPLLIYLTKKEKSPFVADQAKEALNFQITMMIGILVGFVLMVVLIGFLIIAVLTVVDIVFTIIAAMKANEGVEYRYPWSLKLIK